MTYFSTAFRNKARAVAEKMHGAVYELAGELFIVKCDDDLIGGSRAYDHAFEFRDGVMEKNPVTKLHVAVAYYMRSGRQLADARGVLVLSPEQTEALAYALASTWS
jgi:hypothetical protein